MKKKPEGYVERGKKKGIVMDKSVDNYTFDITFCDEVCGNKFCYRNSQRISNNPEEVRFAHSFSKLRYTEFCPSYLED